MWQQASDWALRRLLKALLKRRLKAVLAAELDVEQLRVSLGRGSLELRDVLLSPEWLAQHAPPGLEVVSGYAGRLALDLSLAGLSCAVALDDVMLSARLAPPPPPQPTSGPGGAAGLDLGLDPGLTAGAEGPGSASDAVGPDDGLRLVAAGVESLVQRMTVTLTRLSVRLEGAPPGPAACLSCAEVVCGPAAEGAEAAQAGAGEQRQPEAGGGEVATTARRVSFAGLRLSVGEEALLAPLAGTLDVEVAWPLEPAYGRQPRVAVSACLQGAQVQATPGSLAALLSLADSLALGAQQGAQQQQQQQQQQHGPATVLGASEVRAILAAQQAPARPQRPPWQHSSLLEELMLPGGGEQLVQEALAGGDAGLTGQEEVEEFFDARSLLGSLQEAFSSAMAASLAPDDGEPGCPGHHPELAASRALALHDLAASVRQDGGVRGRRWSVSLSCPSLSLSLLYPPQQGAAPPPAYAPRLAAEVLRLAAWAEAESPPDGGPASLSLGACVEVVEVAEHLPFPSSSPASSTAAAAACAWVPAEEMARVPALLPGVAGVSWELPTFAGDYPVPNEPCGEGVGGTLTQLADLSAATAYLSAAATLDQSMLLETAAGQGGGALPRVQVVPVLRCGGESGAALAAHGSLAAGRQQQQGLGLDVVLQPVSIWCTLPLLERLQSLAACVAGLAEQGGAAPDAHPQPCSSTSQRAAVAAAIASALRKEQQQQAGQPAEPAPLRVSVHLPGACILASVPGAGAAAGTDSLKYFALCASSSGDPSLYSLPPSLGRQQAQELVQRLKQAGVEPSLQLRRGGDGTGGTGGAGAWTCSVRLASLELHAVAEEGAVEAHVGESMLGPVLALARVAHMQGEGAAGARCLSVDATWCPLASPCPPLLDDLWAAAHPGVQPGACAPLQRLAAGAPLRVSVRGHAPLEATLDRRTLWAASALADGVLQLSAAPPPPGPATTAVLQLECEVRCEAAAAAGPPFYAAARAVSATACANVDGVAGSSVLALSVGGAELTRREEQGPGCAAGGRRVLAHSSGQQQGEGPRRAAVQLLAVLRPTGAPCQLCSNGRYVLPSRGRVSVAGAGLTLLLDDAGRLAWLNDVWAPAAAQAPAAGCPPVSAASALPPPPPLCLELGLSLLGGSVRYEPRDSSAVAALLSIGSLSWSAAAGQPHSSARAERLSLHLAAARQPEAASGAAGGDGSGGGGGGPLAPGGFHQVAAEAGLTLRLPGPSAPQQGQGVAGALREVALDSSALGLSLSRHTLGLLRRLLGQLAQQRGDDGGGPSPRGSSSSSSRDEPGGVQGGGGGVDVMRGVVQRAYAAPPRPLERPAEASVFLDGGWYDAEGGPASGPYAMSPAGSPPDVVGRDWLHGFAQGRQEAREEQGVWYGGGSPPRLLEEYVALAGPDEAEAAASFGSPDFDCLLLPRGHPQPDRRVSVRLAAVTLTLADTFATVLLPAEEEAGWEEAALAGQAAPGGGRAVGGQGADGGPEEELVALSAQVQARLEGVTLQLDTWAEGAPQQAQQAQQAQQQHGAAAPTLRLALAVRGLEVRDSFQARQGGGGAATAAAAPAAGWAGLRRMLGYHASVRRVRGPRACVVQAVVEGVRAEADVEYRARLQLLPLLLHLDQAALAFLQHLLAPQADQPPTGAAGAEGAAGAGGAAPCPPPGGGGGQPFFQRCEVLPFTLTIHYRPHRVDLAALSGGQLAEVLNLVPWGGVSLSFRHLRLSGMQGLAGLGTAVASAYVEDIARHQAHRFVGGIAPIKSICRVSAAAAQLVAIPRQQLYRRSSADSAGALALTALADPDFRRQMQRGLAGLVRAVALEALNLGASLAAGAEVALAGQASASHTASTRHALRQAGAQLRSSSGGPRSAASAAATAARTALLGVRNTLDRERTLERRLNS